MKKLLGLLLLVLFALSLFYTVSINTVKNTTDKTGYASILPIPPPEPPARRGC